MVEKSYRISDVYQLQGLVPKGIFNRVIEVGDIPTGGPGRYSVPHALERRRQKEGLPSSIPQTLQDRRDWNLNHRLGH